MFLKVILPLLLMLAVYMIGRLHASRRMPLEIPSYTPPPARMTWHGKMGKAALILLIAAALSMVSMLYSHWRSSGQVVEVQVFNVDTGKQTVYEAFKADIHGRSFSTRDGRSITLADVERLEVVPK
ncbi:MAG: hypothetical protein HQL77_12145 [Magnetococcales bacterium]|nr:hypothetical protein [Magnetococcales bacterium]